MKRLILVLGCGLFLLAPSVRAQSPVDSPSPVPKHGGKIESKYDGFTYETIMRLRKMKVNCDGIKDKFKDACVSVEVVLHLPGLQLNYVRNVTVQVMFENKDGVRFHPPDERNLSISTDAETFRFGRMELITNANPGNWDTRIETLKATVPYKTFKKIIQSDTVEIQVGHNAVSLRENNIAALRDLNSRVLTVTETSSRVTGVVVDVNDARIVGATITVANIQDKKISRSNDEGRFAIDVPAGTYQITVEQPGFKRFQRAGFRVDADTSELSVRMEVAPPQMPVKVH